MHGVPVFMGTRVPVRTFFDYIDPQRPLKSSIEEFLEGFPTVKKESLSKLLEETRQSLEDAKVAEDDNF